VKKIDPDGAGAGKVRRRPLQVFSVALGDFLGEGQRQWVVAGGRFGNRPLGYFAVILCQ